MGKIDFEKKYLKHIAGLGKKYTSLCLWCDLILQFLIWRSQLNGLLFFSENENGIRQNKHFVIWGFMEFIHLDSGGDVQVIFTNDGKGWIDA